MNKFKNIEFLRIILMFGIVMLHSFIDRTWNLCKLYPDIDLFQNLKKTFFFANNGVDAFFIIAGFLLILTFKQNLSIKTFMLKKYIRLSPVIAFSMIVCYLNGLLHVDKIAFFKDIASVFLLNTPLYSLGYVSNGPTWFTSALFINLLIYFCIIKFVPKKYAYYIIGLLIVTSYGLLEHFRHGVYSRPGLNMLGFLNVGTLRAIGGIGLGCLIGFLYKNNFEKIKSIYFSLYQKIIISLLEISSFTFILWWSFCIHKKINNIFYVLVFSLLLILFIFKKGILSKACDKDIFVKIGQYQYSIFIMHVPLLKFLHVMLWNKLPEIVINYTFIIPFATYFIIVLIGVLTYHLVEEPAAKYFSKKFELSGQKPKESL